MIALTVLFQTARLATIATLGVEPAVLNFGLKSVRVAILNRVHGKLSLFITVVVGTIAAVAFGTAFNAEGEAITVQLEALGLLAVADGSSSCWGDHHSVSISEESHNRAFAIGLMKKELVRPDVVATTVYLTKDRLEVRVHVRCGKDYITVAS